MDSDTGTNIERSGVNMSLVVTVGTIAVLLLVVIFYTTQGYFSWMETRELARKNADYTPRALTALVNEQVDRLTQAHWVTPNEVAAVPIRQAMAAYAAEHGHPVPEGWVQRSHYDNLWNPVLELSNGEVTGVEASDTAGGDVSHAQPSPAHH